MKNRLVLTLMLSIILPVAAAVASPSSFTVSRIAQGFELEITVPPNNGWVVFTTTPSPNSASQVLLLGPNGYRRDITQWTPYSYNDDTEVIALSEDGTVYFRRRERKSPVIIATVQMLTARDSAPVPIASINLADNPYDEVVVSPTGDIGILRALKRYRLGEFSVERITKSGEINTPLKFRNRARQDNSHHTTITFNPIGQLIVDRITPVPRSRMNLNRPFRNQEECTIEQDGEAHCEVVTGKSLVGDGKKVMKDQFGIYRDNRSIFLVDSRSKQLLLARNYPNFFLNTFLATDGSSYIAQLGKFKNYEVLLNKLSLFTVNQQDASYDCATALKTVSANTFASLNVLDKNGSLILPVLSRDHNRVALLQFTPNGVDSGIDGDVLGTCEKTD